MADALVGNAASTTLSGFLQGTFGEFGEVSIGYLGGINGVDISATASIVAGTTLSAGAAAFAVASDGSFGSPGFAVDIDGAISAANANFSVDASGNMMAVSAVTGVLTAPVELAISVTNDAGSVGISAGVVSGSITLGAPVLVQITSPSVVVSGDVSAASVSAASFSGPPQVPVTAVGSLPTCDGAAEGTIRGVNDALLPAALAIVAAGGAVHVPTYCNGTNWIVM